MAEYIDKKALLTNLDEAYEDFGGRSPGFYGGFQNALKRIKDFPTAEVAPVRHGEWLLKHMGHGHYWECSECHTNPCIYVTENTNFCPNCGARMDGGADSG